MIKIIKYILFMISRIIYSVIPKEFKSNSKTVKSKLDDNLVDEIFNHFLKDLKKSLIFNDIWKIREYAIQTSLLNDKNKNYYYLEFGAYKGGSTNFFSKYVNKLYTFDSFEGLKEDWQGSDKPMGYYNLEKKIPSLNLNVEPIVGWVEDTLDDFLKKHNPKINFVHLDLDTYSSSKFTLDKLKPYLVKNAIIIFDQLSGHIGWESGEYKALKEVFNENEFEYKAFKNNIVQSVIQIK